MADTINTFVNYTPEMIDTFDITYNRSIQQESQGNLDGIITRINTYREVVEDYFLGDVDRTIIENPDDPTFSGVGEEKVTLRSKEWKPKSGLRIYRKQEVPEYAAQFTQRIEALTTSVNELPEQQVIGLIEAGETGKAWDGVNYFGDTSAVNASDKRHNVNIRAGRGVSQQNIDEDFADAQADFRLFNNGDKKTLINITPTVILAPVRLETTFLKLFQSTGTSESDKSSAVRSNFNVIPNLTLVISKYLTNQKSWYLFDTRMNPMIWINWLQRGNDGNFTDVRLIVDESQYNLKDYKQYSLSRWGGAQYGLPIGAYKVKNS